jgi:flagella basal body P-ring formation protein FlgA
MIRPVICMLALPLALGGAWATAAAAQSAKPALRPNVTVAGDIVRIGDLVENAGAAADVPVFRAPDLGTSGTVATERIVDAIRPHQLIAIDTRGLSEVIVTRASHSIAAHDIAARVARALEGQYGFGEAHNIWSSSTVRYARSTSIRRRGANCGSSHSPTVRIPRVST